MKKIFLVKNRNAFSTKWVCDFGSKLDELGYDVSIVCDEKKYNSKNDVPVSSRVKKVNLGKIFSLFTPLKFRKFVNKEKPDITFAYFIQDLFNLALCLDKTKIIMMFHNPPVEVFEKFNPIKKAICKRLLKKVTIQVLMSDFVSQIKDFVGDVNVEVIPNQVMVKTEQKDYGIETKTIIQVAQIAKTMKRQHLLIEAFSLIAAKYPDWKVLFFGKVKKGKHTKYYKQCLARIKELGLEKQIIFKGFSRNITQEYLLADINTLPSRSEGFGYGLADGLALGVVGIAFADAVGVNQILVDGQSGYLVKDVQDYAEKLDLLISDRALRQKMGEFARKDMQNRYSPEVIITAWQKLIEKIINQKD